MQELLLGLERLPAVAELRQSGILYPIVSSLHILGIGLLIGGVAVVDWRILRAREPGDWRPLMVHAVPVAAAGLGLALVTGAMLFAVRASLYIQNPALLLKWALIALGLLNVAAVHRMLRQRDASIAGLKLGAAVSLAVWIAAIFAGRWIAFID